MRKRRLLIHKMHEYMEGFWCGNKNEINHAAGPASGGECILEE